MLDEIAQRLQQQGLSTPFLLRFPDILHARIKSLTKAFQQAIHDTQYQGSYHVIYPIKVNQQRSVVTEIAKHNNSEVGLEAGSKSELLAIIGLTADHNTTIVCNGYKDAEYIKLALIAQKLGHRVYLVLEKYAELTCILQQAKKLNTLPRMGIRVRALTTSPGKWQDTVGPKSKFGLSATQILKIIDRLTKEGALHCLQLLHFHFGSQIANIGDIQKGIQELARYYAELHRKGAPINVVDVGGGLGVDYDGTHTRRFSSINYTIQEYANNIVYTLNEVCAAHQLQHPTIFSESGRAITAHHAVLITNVVDHEPTKLPDTNQFKTSQQDIIIQNLQDNLSTLTARSAMEAYHDANYLMTEAHQKYLLNVINLETKAVIDELYILTCWRVRNLLKPHIRAHREIIDEINDRLADKFFLNFSIFQSLPDSWAIDQIFPILPLTQLNEKPSTRSILQDITCDSDGRIDCYIDGDGIESTLPLPTYHQNSPYLFGIFLVGAYQEILGDMHNLYGDTASANVRWNESNYEISEITLGDRVCDVLNYVDIDQKQLLKNYQRKIVNAKLTTTESTLFLQALTEGLQGYTYLED